MKSIILFDVDGTITNFEKIDNKAIRTCFENSKLSDECLVHIFNNLPDLINDKGLTETDQIVFALPKTNTLTADQVTIATNKGWTVTNTTY